MIISDLKRIIARREHLMLTHIGHQNRLTSVRRVNREPLPCAAVGRLVSIMEDALVPVLVGLVLQNYATDCCLHRPADCFNVIYLLLPCAVNQARFFRF